MAQETTLSYKCNSCGKEFGPLTTKSLGEYVEIPANCMVCKTIYTTKAEITDADIILVDKECKKCNSELEVFQGKCPSCGAIAVGVKK